MPRRRGRRSLCRAPVVLAQRLDYARPVTEAAPFPVTLLTGFLGAGKTTLLSRLLSRAEGRRFGVLVNDFGDINIDAELIEEVVGGVMRLTNGCVCCTLQGDLMSALFAMIEAGKVEHALIETSDLSDARNLARSFFEVERQGLLRVDGIIALVDAEQFEASRAKDPALLEGQVQAADLVVISKGDRAGPERVRAVELAIRAISSRPRVIAAALGEVPLALLIGGDLAQGRPEGAQEPVDQDEHEHAGHAHHLHYSTWTFHSDAPLSWRALAPVLAQLPEALVRAKGVLHIVERPGQRCLLQVVGTRVHVRTVPLVEGKPLKTAIVFIGVGAAELGPALEAKLLACAP